MHTCTFMCFCVHMCVCMYVCLCVPVGVYVHMSLCVHMPVYMSAFDYHKHRNFRWGLMFVGKQHPRKLKPRKLVLTKN